MKWILILIFSLSFANKKIYTDYSIENGRLIVKDGGNSIVNVSIKDIRSTLLEIEDLIRIPKNASPAQIEAINALNTDAKINKAKRYIMVDGKKIQVSTLDMFEILKMQADLYSNKKPTPLTKAQRQALESDMEAIKKEATKHVSEKLKIEKDKSFKTYDYVKTDSLTRLIDDIAKSGGNPWFVTLDGNTYVLGNQSSNTIVNYQIGVRPNPSILKLATPRRDLVCNLSSTVINSSQAQLEIDGNYALIAFSSINQNQNVVTISTVNGNAQCRNDTLFQNSFEGAQ